ncbi:VOC family protein [Arsenicicoccus dermatophilus]|uniref:VOC family protein n=1 Tax=Arsenicicoccus dermatophilus TaxID=1076331 RepID=UPI003916E412
MALARYVDLTIDARDTEKLARFWSRALGLRMVSYGADGYGLLGEDPTDTVWIRPVPHRVDQHRRVHLDIYAADTDTLVEAGGSIVDRHSYPWDIALDPEQRELGVVVRPSERRRMYQVVVDSPDPEANAAWWGRVLDTKVHPVPEDPAIAFIEPIPGAPFESIVFARETRPKSDFNSMRLAITAQTPDVLLLLGATMCDEDNPDPARTWMRDPFGNEFTWVAP